MEKGVNIAVVVVVNVFDIVNAKFQKRRTVREGVVPATGRRAMRRRNVGEAVTGDGKGVMGKYMDTQSHRITISLT